MILNLIISIKTTYCNRDRGTSNRVPYTLDQITLRMNTHSTVPHPYIQNVVVAAYSNSFSILGELRNMRNCGGVETAHMQEEMKD